MLLTADRIQHQTMQMMVSPVYLITGGAGFIGSHLAEALIQAGVRVRVLDDLSTDSLDNLEGVLSHPLFEFVQGTVMNPPLLHHVMSQVDVVFHMAALTSVSQSFIDPVKCFNVNVQGTLNVLRAALQNKVRRVVLSSTSAVYESWPEPVNELSRQHPTSPYAVSKAVAEEMCVTYGQHLPIETVCLRYFNVYGPRQSSSPESGVIAIFADRLNRCEPCTIYGSGQQVRDFVYVEDVARANMLAAVPHVPGNGMAFNIGTGVPTTINELYRLMAERFGMSRGMTAKLEYMSRREGDIECSLANVERAKNLLGWSPKTSLKDGPDGSVLSGLDKLLGMTPEGELNEAEHAERVVNWLDAGQQWD